MNMTGHIPPPSDNIETERGISFFLPDQDEDNLLLLLVLVVLLLKFASETLHKSVSKCGFFSWPREELPFRRTAHSLTKRRNCSFAYGKYSSGVEMRAGSYGYAQRCLPSLSLTHTFSLTQFYFLSFVVIVCLSFSLSLSLSLTLSLSLSFSLSQFYFLSVVVIVCLSLTSLSVLGNSKKPSWSLPQRCSYLLL